MDLHPTESLVQIAFRGVKNRCQQLGFDSYWRVFRSHDLEGQSFSHLSKSEGIPAALAASQVRIVRRIFRAVLRAEVNRDHGSDSNAHAVIEDLATDLERDPGAATASLSALSVNQVCLLLALAMEPVSQPIESLLDRLLAPDGRVWLAEVVQRGPVTSFGAPERMLLHGEADVAQLRAIKEMCKVYYREAPCSDDRLAALAGYFLSVASALGHHAVLITGQSRRGLESSLWDLSAGMIEPWVLVIRVALDKMMAGDYSRVGTR